MSVCLSVMSLVLQLAAAEGLRCWKVKQGTLQASEKYIYEQILSHSDEEYGILHRPVHLLTGVI